jgi:AcrR family transcriptional regulator
LVVRIAPAPDGRPASDLTARARIRDAAIECFAGRGFDASFRTIAQRAGVSPGLITHHFGSKDALRAECDAEVLRRYRETKHDAVERPNALFEALASPAMSADVTVYILRAVHAGGEPAREFLEHLIDDARSVMQHGVDTGLVRPSRDEEARLRYLAYQSTGALLVQFITTPGITPSEFVATLHERASDQILPTLELFTEGLLTTRRMLDDYLVYIGDPPGPLRDDESRSQTA